MPQTGHVWRRGGGGSVTVRATPPTGSPRRPESVSGEARWQSAQSANRPIREGASPFMGVHVAAHAASRVGYLGGRPRPLALACRRLSPSFSVVSRDRRPLRATTALSLTRSPPHPSASARRACALPLLLRPSFEIPGCPTQRPVSTSYLALVPACANSLCVWTPRGKASSLVLDDHRLCAEFKGLSW